MLAQELSDAMILKPQTSEYGFSDILETPTTQALKAFSFKDEQDDWQAIGAKTLPIKEAPTGSNGRVSGSIAPGREPKRT